MYDIFTRQRVIAIWLTTVNPPSLYDCNTRKESPMFINHDLLVSFLEFSNVMPFWTPCLVVLLPSSLSHTRPPFLLPIPVTVYSSQSHWNEASLSQKPHTHTYTVALSKPQSKWALCGTAFLTRLFICWTSSHQGGRGKGREEEWEQDLEDADKSGSHLLHLFLV